MNVKNENMDLYNNSQNNLKGITRLIGFFKSSILFYKESSTSFHNKFKLIEENTFPEKSILFNNLDKIRENFEKCLLQTVNIAIKMEKELITPLEDFKMNQKSMYQETYNKLKSISNELYKYCNLLDIRKKSYYKYSFKLEEIKSNKKKGVFTSDETTAEKDFQTKLMSQVKNSELLYKYELERYNTHIKTFNEKYAELMKEMKRNEESRIYFIKASMDKYKIYMEEFQKNNQEYINLLNTLTSKEICEKETILTNQEINKYLKNENEPRLNNENFIPYNEYYKDNKINDEILNFEVVTNEENIITNFNEQELINYINEFVDKLLNVETITKIDMATIFELIKNTNNNCDRKFLDIILERKKESSLIFLNLKNLEYLSEILAWIAITYDSLYIKKFELNFKIIFIAERVFYQEQKTNKKIYLSAILGRNRYFRTKTFWKNIIELKLANKLQDYVIRMKNLTLPNESKNSIFSKLGTKLGLNNEIYKKSLVGKSRIVSLIKDYNMIDISKIPIVDSVATQEMATIIRDNIPSFSAFNFPSEESLDMIADLTEQYRISKEYINFYVTYNNVSNYTVRRLLQNEIENSINKNIKFRKYDNDDKFVKIISTSLKFLDRGNYINLMLINKKIGNKISKKIYKIILREKNIDNKIRIQIWENLLGIKEIKKKYNYQEVLKNATDDRIKTDVKIDVVRTYVGDVENPEEVREKISNVLISVASLNGTIKYCQGMNYIVEFILELTDEETAFYLFLSFFINTEYPLIFAKDLLKLKIFFYVFKRLISLFEPELYSYLNMNSVDVHFFMPPWFITLFLSSRQHIKQKQTPQVLIRILDNFILSGWKSLMKVGIKALNSFEKDLMKLKYEDMLNFLINDMLKNEFFKDDNLESIENCFIETKIQKRLIKNIEAEYLQDSKLKNQK